MVSTLYLCFLGLAFGLVSGTHLHQKARHDKRHHGRSLSSDSVTKRDDTFTGRATWFNVGLGACGQNNVPSDYIVALNYIQYGDGYPGPYCFQSITIEYNGQQEVATIMDECPQGSCDASGQLDLSTGLFTAFAGLDVGQFDMTWWFNDDPPSGSDGSGDDDNNNNGNDDDGSTTSTDPAPWTSTQTSSTTSSSDPAPWTSTTTSTTSSEASTTSTASPSLSSTNASPGGSNTASGTSTTASAPSESATSQMDNVVAMDNLLVAFGEIVIAGGGQN
ncbi:hypothetical protein CALVIDRAFT_599363 [Calocera viscosa TUFC12733]|uniref:RlpA-like protein double-psi beta-barrel domain-containing protein n=1 Tax=Calocera viscosa (strain TUFC12733) TaxID=1330018 RepID=A0A167L0N7_CALVF|nr:hypothetical protein CALVIDRAFT_599363 [Calocera viscosa TUFC12733]